MNNIFISATKNFYNYITSTHCKDFKSEWEEFYKNKKSLDYYCCLSLSIKRLEKKTYNSLDNLYSSLLSANDDFLTIKNYIFKKSSEQDEFENWMKVLNNFADFVFKYADPLFIGPNENICSVIKDQDNTKLIIDMDNFSFIINFEKSKIKKNNSTLFDTITGLDKENTLSFIKIKIVNKRSNSTYSYEYMEDSSLINKNGLDDEICDIQLGIVKDRLDNFIYNYIAVMFDSIINRELIKDEFNLFYSTFIKRNFKELEEKWLPITNME